MKNFNLIKRISFLAVLLYLIFAFIWLSRTLEHKASESTGHRSLSDQQNIQPDKSYAETLLDQLNNEMVQQDDPRLIKLIRDHFIEPTVSFVLQFTGFVKNAQLSVWSGSCYRSNIEE